MCELNRTEGQGVNPEEHQLIIIMLDVYLFSWYDRDNSQKQQITS